MLAQSVLSQSALESEIGSQSVLNPKSEKRKRNLYADLLLTALIDAFSILVIFLLMNFSSTGEILFLSKDIQLPKAATTDILERNTVVKFQEGKFFVEEKPVTQDELVQELLDVRKNWSDTHPEEEFKGIVTIQADRGTKFESLNSVVLAMANTGFSEIRFAVIAKQ